MYFCALNVLSHFNIIHYDKSFFEFAIGIECAIVWNALAGQSTKLTNDSLVSAVAIFPAKGAAGLSEFMGNGMKSFHHTNYGSFGGSLPTDNEGYVHLTVKGWMDAGKSRAEASELAKVAKRAVKDANAHLAEWRNK